MATDFSNLTDERLAELSELLASYSNGDFSAQGRISENFDALDTIISGINMLGEEIHERAISRDFMTSVFKAVKDLLFTVDAYGLITECNEAAEYGLGLGKEKIIGQDLKSFFQFSDEDLERLNRYRGGQSNPGDGIGIEGTFNSFSKGKRYIHCDISSLFNRDSPSGYVILIRDITEKKMADKILLRAMVSALEEERKRVANDLHDSIGQELAGLRIILSHMLKMPSDAGATSVKDKDMCISIIDHTIQGLRDVCYNLLPSSLLGGGLYQTLLELKRRIPKDTRLHIEYDKVMEVFPLSLQVDLFRIIQEFISNTLKHARAKEVHLTFKDLGKNGVQMSISDDGIGFNITSIPPPGRGSHTIKSRAETFNGLVHMSSSPGAGTTLTVTFNLENYEEYNTFDHR